jgi:hypothetical protein
MAELQAHALTSLPRLKARLSITDTGFDSVLERMINASTGLIERHINRRLKEATYTNEVYSVANRGTDTIALNQIPVTVLTSAAYRAGTPSTPSWTAFTTDQYELMNDGASGIVRIYGGVPYGTNAVRFTYTAGFKINFDAIANPAEHTLPEEISDLCERIATRMFKKREAEGKSQEAFEGSSVTWSSLLEDSDKDILAPYLRLPVF